MTSTLRTLLDRVEKGEGADFELDCRLAWTFGLEPWLGRPEYDIDLCMPRSMVAQATPALTSSIDASRALVQAAIPGALVASGSMEHGPFCSMVVPREDGTYIGGGIRAVAKSEPRAVLACLLRAKIAQEEMEK